MKILIYGFKPWGKLNKNIGQEIIKRIKLKKNIKKIIFDVKFEKKQFKEALKYKPDIILGLGMCGRGKKIRIERKARNIKKTKKDEKLRIIDKEGKDIFVNIKIKNERNSRISYNAGWYICNFSMYVLLKNIKNNQKYAFFHIPKNYDLMKAIKFFSKIIDEIKNKNL